MADPGRLLFSPAALGIRIRFGPSQRDTEWKHLTLGLFPHPTGPTVHFLRLTPQITLEHEWGMTLFYTLFEPTTRTFLVGNSGLVPRNPKHHDLVDCRLLRMGPSAFLPSGSHPARLRPSSLELPGGEWKGKEYAGRGSP
ncbi:predicted protein [Phaeodactylum tricornutum CCAP 1055/1]|uniref:Uncharacterized protein n=1 Tax=Phaeodactylum tricornutum (strain CCAP 1055/1) TaxID=556484 RepID=B7FS68_PHATC|nr:predicted protein [Phaeodactylum tricornutum CCAP 1055/1]EEC50427.1 predicted protein [Phaeodactylum tricornutum CCAP 1055/1]|eukprot:XP_002177613.1 predicted protein [Phaeodactylum tricornutum CCAP 1055/1]